MKGKGFITLAILIVASSLSTKAQVHLDSSRFGNYYQFNYTSQQGLAQNSIMDIALDNKGFMWLTTWKGISRFDGANFRNFTVPDRSFRDYAIVNFLHFKDKILMQGRDGYLIRDGQIIEDTLKGSFDSIVIGNANQYLYPGNYRPFVHHTIPKNSGFFYVNDSSIYLTEKGKDGYFASYYENGIKMDADPIPIAKASRNLIANPFEKAFIFEGSLFIWEENGWIKRYDKGIKTGEFKSDISSSDIRIHWKYGHKPYVYHVANGDLLEFAFKKGHACLKLIVSKFRPSGAGILCVLDDTTTHSVMVGTEIQGLFKFRPKAFNTVCTHDYPTKNSIASVVEIGKDSVLTNHGTLITPEGISLVDKNLRGRGMVVFKSSHEPAWILEPSLRVYNGESMYDERHSFKFSACVEDKRGVVWCLEDNGIFSYENEHFERTRSLMLFQALAYYDSLNDVVWISTKDRKTYKFFPTSNKLTEFEPLKDKEVEQILFTSSGLTLVKISHEHFQVLQNDKLISLPTDPANYLQYAHCIVEDDAQNLWISSDHGLFRTHLCSVENFLEDPKNGIYYYYYDKGWGFRNNEFNSRGCPCGLKMSNGNIVMPSIEGAVFFDPSKVTLERHGLGIEIERILLDGKDTMLASNSHLDPNFHHLEFDIFHSFFDHPNNVYMSYKLQGYKDVWKSVGANSKIIFSKLPYGEYTLKVRKKTGFGKDDFVELTFPFVVDKRYYQTTWFLALLLSAILLVIRLVFNWRLSSVKKRREQLKQEVNRKTLEYQKLSEKLKKNVNKLEKISSAQEESIRIRREMTSIYAHDIRGPLHFIKHIADKTAENLNKIESDKLKDYLDAIKESSEGVFAQTDKMFNWNRVQDEDMPVQLKEFNVKETIEDETYIFLNHAKEKNVRIQYKIDPEMQLFTEEDLFRIVINNLVQNAIKYTTDGTITISGLRGHYCSTLIVKDTGTGIHEEQLEKLNHGLYSSIPGTNAETGKAFGLRMVKDILTRLNAKLQIESELEIGTSMKIVFNDDIYVD